MKVNSQSIKYWRIKLKKEFQVYKKIQNNSNTNKFYIWSKSEIEKNINLAKGQKKLSMRIKIDIKNNKQFWLKGGVEKK